MTANESIKKITDETTTFLGVTVKKYNYGYEIRQELQRMAEQNEISPAEFWKALKLTPRPESESLRVSEYEALA